MSDAEAELSVDDALAVIDQIDTDNIDIGPETLMYFETVAAYIKCYDELENLYQEMDPSRKLAEHEMPEIRLPIQQLSLSGEPVTDIEELYEVAEAMFPVFAAKIEGLLVEGGAADDALFKLPPGENKLKGRERASAKAADDYSGKKPGPPESWLYDIVRGSILFENADQVLDFLERIRGDETIEIVKSKNRFRTPTLSGYRDWNLQLQISTDDGSIKHICELQLHLHAIKDAAGNLGSHSHYEYFRRYYAGETIWLYISMLWVKVIGKECSLDNEFFINVIQNPLDRDRMLLISYVFETLVNDYELAIVMTYVIRESMEPVDLYRRLGTLLVQQGKLKEAMVLLEKALELQLEAEGPEHQDTLHINDAIASVLEHEGKLDEAFSLYIKIWKIRSKTPRADPDASAANLLNLSKIETERGNLDLAMKFAKMSLFMGPEDSGLAASYQQQAVILCKQGKLDEAAEKCQDVLGMYSKRFGPDHARTLSALDTMATILEAQGKSEEAMALHQKVEDRGGLKKVAPDRTFRDIGLIKKLLMEQEEEE